ncbi:MAG: TonB-dependent receptor [Steroidobacteraceae bacterium]
MFNRPYLSAHLSAITLAISVVLAPTVVFAQTAAATSADSSQIEEVLVTARKREESLQDVPLSVTALNASSIEEMRITTPDDISRFTPGLSIVSGFGRSGVERPTMRGQTNIQGAPNASFFVDGIYVAGGSLATETSNLERIEVIKGPQAALYGRATFAGAINYITKRPTNELSGKLSVTAAQHGETDLVGSLSGPLIQDTLLFYVGARHYSYDGEYTNQFDLRSAGQQNSDSGTIKLLWTPNESFEATLLATMAKDHDPGAIPIGLQGRQFNNCQLRVLNGTAANNFAGTILPRSPGYQCGTVLGANDLVVNQRSDVLPDQGSRRDDKRFALTTKTSFGAGYELTTVAGYHEQEGQNQLDQSYDAYDTFTNAFGASQVGAFWSGSASKSDDFSAEVRLDSPAEERFRWRVGGYYLKANDDDIKNKKYVPLGTTLNVAGTTNCVVFSSYIECPQSAVEPLALRELTNRAVFADVEYDFTDKLTATFEARYAIEKQQQINTQTVGTLNCALPTSTPGVVLDACKFTGEFKSTTPRLTVRYEASPEATYYFNAAKGTKPGGFNSITAVATGIDINVPVKAVYDEEESKVFEVGGKFVFLERRASLNVALFYTDLTGQQLTSNIAGIRNGAAIVNSFTANIGATEIKGLELDGSFRVNEAWDVRGTFSFIDSKVKEFFDNNQVNLTSPNGVIRTTPLPYNQVLLCNNPPPAAQVPGRPAWLDAIAADLAAYGSVAGNTQPRTPKVQASLSSTYKGTFSNGLGWRVGGDVTYEGSKYGQVDNFNETGARTYVGARAALISDHWDLTLWGKNLTDDDTPLDILRWVDTRGITPATYFTPAVGGITPRAFGLSLPRGRQIGVTAAYRF